jgi:hypothetical protein
MTGDGRTGDRSIASPLRGLMMLSVTVLIASCGTPLVNAHHVATPSTTAVTSPTTAPTSTTSNTGSVADPCGVVSGPDVVIISESPCQVSTTVGVTIQIILDPGFEWETPVSNSSVIEVTDVVRRPSGQLRADLIAAQAGRATVSSAGAVVCPPRQVCPALVRLWRLLVTVG